MDESDPDSDASLRPGGSIPGTDAPAFRLHVPEDTPIPLLIASPHSGRLYPEGVRGEMREPEYAALRLEDRYVDRIAREIARQTGAALIIAEAPRAMLDLNRDPEDMDWGMVAGATPKGVRHSLANRRSRSGLGLVPRRLAGMGEVWKRPLDRADLEARIAGIHRPYHSAVGETLDRLRDRWGAALLVDLHSMPPLRKRFPDERPAEFVLGDRFGASCEPRLVAAGLRYLASHQRPAAHNRPYAGGYVLDRHGMPSRAIHAVQLEICRSTYLDARFSEPSARMAGVVKLLAGLVRELGTEVGEMGGLENWPLAAE